MRRLVRSLLVAAAVVSAIASGSAQNRAAPKVGTISPWERPHPGWLWVLDVYPGGSQILLVDPQTQSIKSTITGFSEMALSPDGSRLYAASGSELAIIDVTAGQIIRTLPLQSRLRYKVAPDFPTLAASPDGRWLYISKRYGNSPETATYTVAVFDTMSGAFLPNEAEIGCGLGVLLPFVHDLQVLCPSTNDARFLQFAPSGVAVSFTRVSFPKGAVINPEVVRTLPVGSSLWDVRTGGVSPDGRAVTAVMGDGQILEIDRATRATRVLAKVHVEGRWVPTRPILYSPDGRRIYVSIGRLATRSNGQGEEIFVLDAQTGRQVATIEPSIPFWSLAISNDGHYLYAPEFEVHRPTDVQPLFEGRIVVIDALNYREIGMMRGIGMWPASVLVAP